jgi:hypothetical protein
MVGGLLKTFFLTTLQKKQKAKRLVLPLFDGQR